jgi:hypothetical protein
VNVIQTLKTKKRQTKDDGSTPELLHNQTSQSVSQPPPNLPASLELNQPISTPELPPLGFPATSRPPSHLPNLKTGLRSDERPTACPGIHNLNNNEIMNIYKILYKKSHIQRLKENKLPYHAHSSF